MEPTSVASDRRRALVLAGLAAAFAAKLAVWLLGANRGLDIGDEGVFLLAIADPAHAPPLFEFYRLLTLLDAPPQIGVVTIRLLRIAVELAAMLALAHAVFRWARERIPGVAERGLAAFLGIALLGALLGVGARGFGYNDATQAVACLAVACGFRLLALAPGQRRRRLAWAAAGGFAVGFQLFVKFPTALLLGALGLTGALALPGAAPRARVAVAGAFAAGAAAAIGLFVLANGGVAGLVAKWREAQELNRVAGYGVREILAVYWHHDLGSHVNALRLWTAAAISGLVAWRWLRGRPDRLDLALCAALAVGTAVLALGSATFHAVNVHPSLVFLFCLVELLAPLAIGVAYLGADSGSSLRSGARLLPLLILFALPLVAMVGTNVALTRKLPAHVAPMFVGFAVLLPALRARGLPRFAATSLGLLAAATSVVFVVHQVFLPYGLPSPLYRQRYATSVLPGLRVDLATKMLVEDLDARLRAAGFARGDPIVALDFMPGLVWALGGRSPGFPFFHAENPALNCWALARSDDPRPPFLILGQDMLLAQRDCLRGAVFPDDFVSLGALGNPYEHAIQYFFGGPPMPYLRVFAPRRETH